MWDVAYALAPSGPGGGGAGLGALLPIIMMFVIFYFLLIRPQQRKAQNVRLMQQNLKKGDRVVFCGGIYGNIVKIKDKDNVVSIEIAEKVKIDVQRNAIGAVAKQE